MPRITLIDIEEHWGYNANEFLFECGLCDYKTPDENELLDHLIEEHLELNDA